MSMHTEQKSDSLLIGIILFFIGGFQNGYTYFLRGGVFANLQTGNMIFLAHTLVYEQGKQCWHYLIPLVAFGFGIFIATRHRLIHHGKHHWRSHLLMVEIILIALCGVLPASWNDLANALISLNAALTVSAFQHFKGYPMASTMMIGNFKAIMTHLGAYSVDHGSNHLHIIKTIGGLMLIFLLGALCAVTLVKPLSIHAIWLLIPLLLIAIAIMEKGE